MDLAMTETGTGGGVDFSGVFGGAGDSGAGGGTGGAGDGGTGGTGGGSGTDGAGAGGGAGGASDPEWYGQLSSDVGEGEGASLRDWVKSIGAPDVNTLAKLARDNQKALRESGRVKVPGEGASAEDMANFRKAIGVPDDVKGYEVPVPTGSYGEPLKGADGKPVELNSALLDRLANKAFEAGVPKAAYDALVQDFVQAQLEELSQSDAKAQQDAQAKVAEWGREAPAKQQDVNRGLAALGLSREEALSLRAALGAGRAMDIFQKLGSGLAEDVMMSGSGGAQRFGMSPAEAQATVDKMKSDKDLGSKVMVPGTPENERYNRALAVLAEEQERRARQG